MSGALHDIDNTPTMCGVCGRVGSFSTFDGWRHDQQDAAADHPFVQVAIADAPAQLLARCDFCNITGDIPWELPVEDFKMPHTELLPDNHWSRGGWAACDTCAGLIRRRLWRALANRAVQTRMNNMRSAREIAFMRAGFIELYGLVRRHITGPIRPYNPEDRL